MANPRTRQSELESKEYLGEDEPPDQGGSAEGVLQRKKGAKDEMKRAKERPAGATRVRKSDKEEG